jgi:hypothetical protein
MGGGKTRGKKSRATVPLNTKYKYFYMKKYAPIK